MTQADCVHSTPPTNTPISSGETFELSASVHPLWQQAVLRLAKTAEAIDFRLRVLFAADWSQTPGEQPNFVQAAHDLIETLINFLDEVDGNDECEPDADLEPGLGWTRAGAIGGAFDLEEAGRVEA